MRKGSYMKITVGGQELSGGDWASHLSSVTVTDSLESLDGFEVSIELPQGTASKLVPKLDVLGKEWEVLMFEDDSKVRQFKGDVLSVSWQRSGGAPRSVTITGTDQLHRLKRGRSAPKKADRRFSGKKASDIVKQVAQDWKLGTGEIDNTDAAIPTFEWQGDDASLLRHLADQNNFVVRLEANGGSHDLVFKRGETYTQEDVSLDFGTDIYDLQASHNIEGMVTKVEVTGRNDAEAADPVKGSADKNKLSLVNGGGFSGPELLGRMGEFPEVIAKKASECASPPEAKAIAEGKLKEIADKLVDGRLTCRFKPTIGCGKKVTITGAGWPLDGTYNVKDVTHSFDASGYRTEVSFGANSFPKS